jgi:tetratricopeptide (TPR) repeat protein
MARKYRRYKHRMNGANGYALRMGLAVLSLLSLRAAGQASTPPADSQEIRIVELQGKVELLPDGAKNWVLTQTNQVLHELDRLRTGANSRVTLQWSDQSVVPFDALSEIEILPPDTKDSLPGLHIVEGIVSFFHRDKPGRIRVITRGATASVEGTEFVVEVAEANGKEKSTLSVIDGKVVLSDAEGSVPLTNGQSASVEPGKAPLRTAGFVANNLLQWCFYYPAVLDLRDLELTDTEHTALDDSLKAYREGDLLAALGKFPEMAHETPSVRIYHAALLLSVGQVEKTEAILDGLDATSPERCRRLADSLRTLIAAVKRQPKPSATTPELATEFLAGSYFEQSRASGEDSLRTALELARKAASRSPEFGFAWERVAELEFSFGHTSSAAQALARSLELSPRDAQALALNGFILAAQNRTDKAMAWFDRSLAVDSALGNAWLGRGLCRIRRGDAKGREDLLVAAALEPQRAALRSYLGKAYANEFDDARAAKELRLALRLDPADPTGWLYLALLDQQENRIDDAVRNLEKSQDLNDNRSLFRSRLLLDEDRAVRSANLASVYRDAGMTDVSVREAAHAVTYDYDNYSAHLFLAESYDALRDPTRFNLRYDTVWFNELLLANLLSPVGAGRLAQNVSEQEYSSLLQADGMGIANSTTARTDGMLTEKASQYGTFGRTSYSFDLDYQHNDGVRVNNGLDDVEWYTTIKQQVTPEDTAFALIKYEDFHSGDNFQYYSQTNARPNFRFDEYEQPIVMAGWHHEWGPGMHTLLLAGRIMDEQDFSDRGTPQLLLNQDPVGGGISPDTEPFDVNYQNKLEIYTAELNQIFQWEKVTLLAGARFQDGTSKTLNTFTNPPALGPLFAAPFENQAQDSNFRRTTGYGYLTVEPFERLWLTGGASYDALSAPANFRNPPLTPGQEHRSLASPKAAVVWEPIPQATLRGMYARSLEGVSIDEDFRLEPTQLAGFPQTFRTLISESIAGTVTAPEFEVYGGALDLKFPTMTYAGVQVEELNSVVRRTDGFFELAGGIPPYAIVPAQETLDYHETVISASVNQFLGDGFVAGLGYKLDLAQLTDNFPTVPVAGLSTDNHATLHESTAYLLYNHPSGFYARFDVDWYLQHNSGYTPAEPGDNFAQENIYAGWRFLNRRFEAEIGLLNLSGGDYQLNPLNAYQELPRKRTFMAKVNFIF